ncbi:MAG: hypothetical protein JW818_07570 [Pirellulales bacterium]|nr:hypothetical protein [Pirellulales bacterium]
MNGNSTKQPGWAALGLLLVVLLVCAGPRTAENVDLTTRRQRVLEMTDQQQAELADAQVRFNALDQAKQEALRRLNRDLDDDPQGPELRQIMHRYSHWLNGLANITRLELMSLPPDERITRVKKLLREEEDARGLRAWLDALGAKIRQSLPPERQKQWDRLPLEQRRGRIFMELRTLEAKIRHQASPEKQKQWERMPAAQRWSRILPELAGHEAIVRLLADPNCLADLRSRLSKESAAELEKMPPKEQWKWVGEKWFALVFQKHREQTIGGGPPDVSDKDLAEFFETLPDKARDSLLQMPSKKMYSRLRDEYLRQTRFGPGGRGPRGPHRPGPDGRPFGRSRSNDSSSRFGPPSSKKASDPSESLQGDTRPQALKEAAG